MLDGRSGRGGLLVKILGSRRRVAGFDFFTILAVATIGLLLVSAPKAFARYSSIVIDAESGGVLGDADADAQNYPASLTKMMTLYLTFEQLEAGKLHLDEHFTVSAHAASQAPSKLDLAPGQAVLLKDLILAVVTHSANDAAVVLAEGIGGSEPAFAERMTAKAHALGMSRTEFHNASGLPAGPHQLPNLTTARDLSRLALALYRDFPHEYSYFATEEFVYKGIPYANHNHLMSSFKGMDGIKTGFIRASGFNLAASAVRNGHRLIGVVMGGESAHARDLKMAGLLNTAFAGSGRPATEMAVAETGRSETAQIDSGDTAEASFAARASHALAKFSPVARAEAATTVIHGTARHSARHEVRETNLGWSIQVGAYAQHAAAVHAGETALPSVAGGHRGKAVEVVPPSPSDKERFYRARITHFSEAEAETACRVLHKKHHDCAVIAPSTQLASLR